MFESTGRSKKLAKHSVAETALRSFLQFRNAADAAQVLASGVVSKGLDFTEDISDNNFAIGAQSVSVI